MDAIERRLAAILSADAVGYTRLMADDAEATVRAIRGARDWLSQCASEHRGRVVDSPGDNLLAEFPSALDATRAAVAMQAGIAERNAALAPERRMPFRIGLHLGDVMVDGERIYGDGVNIASRLEGLAEPGGVCLSAAVHELVRGQLDEDFRDLGEREVKNVPHPLRVFAIAPASGAAPVAAPRDGGEQPAIAVLPFDDLSGDAAHAWLAEAIAGDLITLLSRQASFPVIARNSSFSYRGQTVDAKRVSRELGARYVVSGTVRALGPRLRVSAELADTRSGRNVWAEKYDRTLEEVFDLQDEVTEAIVSALRPALRVAEAERARRAPPESLEAWALVNRAWTELQSDIGNPERAEAALAAADRAIESDPGYGLAHALRGLALSLLAIRPLAGGLPVQQEQALESTARAAALAPDDSQVWQIQGAVMGNLGRTHDAIRAHRRALELDPYNAQARAALGIAMIFAGEGAASLPHIDRALELSPRDPLLYNWLAYRSLLLLVLGRHAEAEADARSSIERAPTRTAGMVRAIALGELGRLEEGRAAYRELERIAPEVRLSSLEQFVRDTAGADLAEHTLATMRAVGFRD